MQISGTGITPFNVFVKRDFKPETKLSLQWQQAANGNYYATDRGYNSDVYQTTITVHGNETDVNNFITEIEANRTAGSNIITLSNFQDTNDRIFGANVDHSGSITAAILDYGERAQRTFKGFSVTMKLQAVTLSFIGSATLPDLCVQVGYVGRNMYTINRYDYYDYTEGFQFQEHGSDTGLFEGVIEFNLSDMANFREYLRDTSTGRGNTISISAAKLKGIDYPFGPNRGSAPWSVKCIQWEDLGYVSQSRLRIRVTFAEVV